MMGALGSALGRTVAVVLLVLGALALARGVLIGVQAVITQVPLSTFAPRVGALLVTGGLIGWAGWALAAVFGPEKRERARP